MLKWGIIGLGNMANVFANSIQEVKNSELVAIASTSIKRLENFSEQFKIEKKQCFNNYEDLINNDKINSIYISTLNDTHGDLIIKSAKAKKNILCEKPITINYEQAKQVLNIIKVSNIFFLEAIAYRVHLQTKTICEIIKSGEIGKIKKIISSFGFEIKKIDKNSRLFNKKFGGGAILDVGCYPTSFSLLIAKIVGLKNLENFHLRNIYGSIHETGVDENASASLYFTDDLEMKLDVAITKNLENVVKIYGDKGDLLIQNPWLPEKKSFIEIHKNNNYYKKFIKSEYSIYSNQINFFNDLLLSKTKDLSSNHMTIEESLINMKIIDEWKKKLNNNF